MMHLNLSERIFAGMYGNNNCSNCSLPFNQHEAGPEFHCPRGTVPPSIRKLWASFGVRDSERTPYGRCPCARHNHS
jgi:hypothetical protein